jgi:8-oxo-dGTP diphosphatase
VWEETGLHCTLGDEVATTDYVDSRGRPKRVRWWLMRPVDGDFEPTDEVDEIRWLEPVEAARLLSYDRDLVLLQYV